MLVDDAQTCRELQRLVTHLSAEPSLKEDLLQEALVNLWQAERLFPGRTKSWYFQNCRFRLLHWLASGRSIDSYKRSTGGKRISLDNTATGDEPAEVADRIDVVDTVSFHDLHAALSRRLSRREQAVLDGLAVGLPLTEVATQARLSYPTALKYRRRIAALVSQLEIPPPLGRRQDRDGVG